MEKTSENPEKLASLKFIWMSSPQLEKEFRGVLDWPAKNLELE